MDSIGRHGRRHYPVRWEHESRGVGLSESNTSLFAEFTSSYGELVLAGTPSHGMDSTGLLEPTVMALFQDDETERARAWYGYER
ncbi:uncharacterized protein G2W53_030840 [Senna tora]|uniref:Uncharacterized protein n=1 Tax=Senna tora TaxID=362788 RepID=A0A834T9R2_9FABA|nr:uncharacterized protein G2W53_030840 [Senna tora]